MDEKAKDRTKILKYISTTTDQIVLVLEVIEQFVAERLRVFSNPLRVLYQWLAQPQVFVHFGVSLSGISHLIQ